MGYADDTPLYVPVKPDGPSQMIKLMAYLSVKFLLLHSDKTEMQVVGPAWYRQQFDQVTVTPDHDPALSFYALFSP